MEEYKKFSLNFNKEAIPGYRFGQAFCNKFGIVDSELFYEQNTGFAIGMIFDNYIWFDYDVP